jgi:opine dehydrogenase
MPVDSLKFAVLGTGNSGQTFAADIALKGFSVNLAEVPEFAHTLHAIEAKGGIEITGEASNGFAKLNMYTTDIAKAIKGVDIIIIGGSAFAHEPLSKALINEFEDDQYVLFTSNFGALRFRKWMLEAGIKTRVTPIESMSLLYATRASEAGVVSCIGIKNNLPVAALPARRTNEFIGKISSVFPQFVAAENILFTSLNNMNPIVHPPMVLFNAGRVESMESTDWNLYADGATESVVKVMLQMDQERMLLLDCLGMKVMAFKDTFEHLYQGYSLGRTSLSDTLRGSPIHSNPAFPAPSTLKTRYLKEDLPFGLTAWSSIGNMWGVPMPNIDAVIRIASTMLEVDFCSEGITVNDLGIEGLSPGELKNLVS